MEKTSYIEINVKGSKGALELSPDNYDIKEILSIIRNAEDLLFPVDKKERPLISYNIEKGSVKHIFKTSIQTVIGFSAVLAQVNSEGSIDFLEPKTARAIEFLQKESYRNDYEFQIRTSTDKNVLLNISRTSRYIRTETPWTETEIYFYGILIDAGGKNKVNIHLYTDEFGFLIIDAKKDYLKGIEENMLYRKFGVRAKGRQNLETGEIDKSSLELIELIDYDPKYNADYLKALINRAKPKWEKIDPDKWLNDIRGNYDT